MTLNEKILNKINLHSYKIETFGGYLIGYDTKTIAKEIEKLIAQEKIDLLNELKNDFDFCTMWSSSGKIEIKLTQLTKALNELI